MHSVLVLVPFAFGEEGVANREAAKQWVELGPDIQFDFRPVKAGPEMYDSHHDWLLADMSMYEAGITAQEEGYDAVVLDAMNDPGMSALRSILDIPVIGPGRASYLVALMLGNRFSILTYGNPEVGRMSQYYPDLYRPALLEAGLMDKCASIRQFDASLDVEHLLGGREEDAYPLMVDACLQCIEDGADVICLGSTTMHAAGPHLAEALPVPVINPGPLTYKLAELVLGLGLTHSRVAYRKPQAPKPEMARAMQDAAAEAVSNST